MFVTALLTMAKMGENPNVHQLINRLKWYIHIMEHFSATKNTVTCSNRDEPWKHAKGKKPITNDCIFMIPFIRGIQNLYRRESTLKGSRVENCFSFLVVCMCWGEGGGFIGD